MINLYMSSATFGTNNNDTMHVCQIKTEEKSKLVIIKFSVQINFYPYDLHIFYLRVSNQNIIIQQSDMLTTYE